MDIPSGLEPSPDNIKNLNDLIQQISLKKACVFIGAGLSHDAGYPLWSELILRLKSAAEKVVGQEVELPTIDTLDQIEFLRDLMGEDSYHREIIQIFGPEGKRKYLPDHHTTISIPFVAIITTNLDFCLENAAMVIPKKVTYQHFPELKISRLTYGDIFHIHGVIQNKNPDELIGSLVLSKRDYEFAYQNDNKIKNLLSELFDYYTLVFIGFSFWDPDFVKVIRTNQVELQSRKDFEKSVGLGTRIIPKHFIIMHRDANVNEVAIKDLGLFPILYGGEKDHHSVLQDLLSYIHLRTTGVIYPEPVVYREMFEDGYHE